MKSTVTKINDTSAKVDVTVVPVDYAPLVEKTYGDIAKKINVPGFRKGKVPRTLINQRVGTAYIIEEVTNAAINQYYQKAALDADLKVMGQPEVEVKEAYSPLQEKDIVFTATVDVRPEIELPKVEGRSVEVEVKDPTKEEIVARVEQLRAQASVKNESGEIEQLDDEDLAATLGAEDFADLKTKVVEDLKMSSLSHAVGDAGDKILEQLLKDVKIPLPEKVVLQQVEQFLNNQNANSSEKKAPTEEERKLATKRAKADISSQVLLDTYADANDIKVGQEEIINYLSNTAYQYGIEPNQFVQMMAQQGQIPMAAAEVSRSKTLAHMLRRVDVKDAKGNILDITRFIGADEEKVSEPKKAPAKKSAPKKVVTKTSSAKSATKFTDKELPTKSAVKKETN